MEAVDFLFEYNSFTEENTMKIAKLISLTMALCLVLCACLFTGCSTVDDGKITVGILQLAPHPALDAATKGFRDVLTEEFGEENIEFIFVNAQGDNNACTAAITDFVFKGVDLIMANATNALQAANNGTTTIPILGTSVTDYPSALNLDRAAYVAAGEIVGTNVSGTSDLSPLDQQAEMLVDLFPDAETVGLLYCSAEPNSEYQIKVIRPLLEAAGKTCKIFSFSDSNDIAQTAAAAAAASDVIYIPTDNTAADAAGAILGAIGDTPVIAGEEGICSGCGVATLSISYEELGRITGEMAVKILKGEEKVEEMKIRLAGTSTKKYNKDRCDELGIDTSALDAKGYVAISAE